MPAIVVLGVQDLSWASALPN